MSHKSNLTAFALVGSIVSGGSAFADEEMDRILHEAMPYMHHSCESVLANFPDDEETVLETVQLMVAVSLFNREADVEAMFPEEEQRESLRFEFLDRLREECASDPDALLAGAVDAATRDALN